MESFTNRAYIFIYLFLLIFNLLIFIYLLSVGFTGFNLMRSIRIRLNAPGQRQVLYNFSNRRIAMCWQFVRPAIDKIGGDAR